MDPQRQQQAQQQSSWRPILPRGETAEGPLREKPPAPEEVPPPRRPSRLPPQRTPVSVACESCRRLKLKCNGNRPSCSACDLRKQRCVYRAEPGESRDAALKRKHRQAEDELQRLRKSHRSLRRIISALQAREDSDVATIVRRLRQTQDPEAIAEELEGGDLLLQLNVAPETKFRFSFPYSPDMPTALLTPDNPYLTSMLYEATFAHPLNQSPVIVSRFEQLQPQYLKPYSAAQIADPRLATVDVARWTNACADNDLMRSLLHTYLLSDYQIFPPFHKDYFLDDILSGSTRFCSSLLVNAVLAHACTCYQSIPNRAEYWNPNSLPYKFVAEARRLWELESMEPSSVTTVQAAMVMNKTYNVCSMDKIGLSYGTQAVSIAYEMGMFKPHDGTLDKAQQVVHDYTAWALYSFLNFQCYFLLTPSPIRDPPAALPPDPEEDPDWYGELSLQYPTNALLIPLNFPQCTKFKFELVAILRSVVSEFLEKEEKSPPAQRRHLFFQAVSRLKSLHAALPAPLSPSQVVFPLHMALHLCYHNIMSTIIRNLISELQKTGPPETLDDIDAQLVHSKVCFETIIRLYYLRNGYEGGNMILLHCLAVLSFMALASDLVSSNAGTTDSSSSQEAARSTLILAAKGLYDQGQNFFISAMILHVLRKQMDTFDADILGRHTITKGKDPRLNKARVSHVRTLYPLNIVKPSSHQESQRLENLFKEYESLAIDQAGSDTDESAAN